MYTLSLIFIAGGVGSVLRYLLAGWVQNATPGVFPWGTLAVNVAGCAAIGFLATALSGLWLVRPELRMALLVGLLGGFTTFSSFAWESLQLARDGQMSFALLNLGLSNGVGLFAAWIGQRVAISL